MRISTFNIYNKYLFILNEELKILTAFSKLIKKMESKWAGNRTHNLSNATPRRCATCYALEMGLIDIQTNLSYEVDTSKY